MIKINHCNFSAHSKEADEGIYTYSVLGTDLQELKKKVKRVSAAFPGLHARLKEVDKIWGLVKIKNSSGREEVVFFVYTFEGEDSLKRRAQDYYYLFIDLEDYANLGSHPAVIVDIFEKDIVGGGYFPTRSATKDGYVQPIILDDHRIEEIVNRPLPPNVSKAKESKINRNALKKILFYIIKGEKVVVLTDIKDKSGDYLLNIAFLVLKLIPSQYSEKFFITYLPPDPSASLPLDLFISDNKGTSTSDWKKLGWKIVEINRDTAFNEKESNTHKVVDDLVEGFYEKGDEYINILHEKIDKITDKHPNSSPDEIFNRFVTESEIEKCTIPENLNNIEKIINQGDYSKAINYMRTLLIERKKSEIESTQSTFRFIHLWLKAHNNLEKFESGFKEIYPLIDCQDYLSIMDKLINEFKNKSDFILSKIKTKYKLFTINEQYSNIKKAIEDLMRKDKDTREEFKKVFEEQPNDSKIQDWLWWFIKEKEIQENERFDLFTKFIEKNKEIAISAILNITKSYFKSEYVIKIIDTLMGKYSDEEKKEIWRNSKYNFEENTLIDGIIKTSPNKILDFLRNNVQDEKKFIITFLEKCYKHDKERYIDEYDQMITDNLDSFENREIKGMLKNYIGACIEKKIYGRCEKEIENTIKKLKEEDKDITSYCEVVAYYVDNINEKGEQSKFVKSLFGKYLEFIKCDSTSYPKLYKLLGETMFEEDNLIEKFTKNVERKDCHELITLENYLYGYYNLKQQEGRDVSSTYIDKIALISVNTSEDCASQFLEDTFKDENKKNILFSVDLSKKDDKKYRIIKEYKKNLLEKGDPVLLKKEFSNVINNLRKGVEDDSLYSLNNYLISILIPKLKDEKVRKEITIQEIVSILNKYVESKGEGLSGKLRLNEKDVMKLPSNLSTKLISDNTLFLLLYISVLHEDNKTKENLKKIFTACLNKFFEQPDIPSKRRDSKKFENIVPTQEESKDWNKESKKPRIEIDKIPRSVDKSTLPTDAVYKDYRSVIVQNISFKTENTEYILERYYSPSEKKIYEAKLPEDVDGEFGAELKAFIHNLYFACGVSKKKIRNILSKMGIIISKGQISNILTKEKQDEFTKEKEDIFKAGMEHSEHVQKFDEAKRMTIQLIQNDDKVKERIIEKYPLYAFQIFSTGDIFDLYQDLKKDHEKEYLKATNDLIEYIFSDRSKDDLLKYVMEVIKS